jgi:hypothetical protein
MAQQEMMTVKRSTWERLKEKGGGAVRAAGRAARRGGRALVKRGKGGQAWLGTAVLIGAGAYVLTLDFWKKNDNVRKYWYGVGIALAVLGFILWKKKNRFGIGVIGLGLMAFAWGYAQWRQTDQTSGPGDAVDNGAGAYVTLDDGRQVFIPKESRAYQELSLGPANANGRSDAERAADVAYGSRRAA